MSVEVAGVQLDARAVSGSGSSGVGEGVHLDALGEQPLGEVAAVLAADPGDEGAGVTAHQPCCAASRSASTIIATSSGKDDLGLPAEHVAGLAGVADQRSTSAGRMKRSSWRTYGAQSSMPTWAKAASRKSRIEWVSPVATT